MSGKIRQRGTRERACVGDRGGQRKATFKRNISERLYVCKRDGVEEKGRDSSISGTLSTFERFVTGERIMEAVKWGCVNVPGVEEHDVGQPTSQCVKIKRLNK